jgi:hypothetical protein
LLLACFPNVLAKLPVIEVGENLCALYLSL